jgi:dehydrogenase/reductase SDR family member 12
MLAATAWPAGGVPSVDVGPPEHHDGTPPATPAVCRALPDQIRMEPSVSLLAPLARRAVDATMEATVVPSFSRIGYAVRSRIHPGWEDLDAVDLAGRRVLVTGANSGLGHATAERLAGLGASLHLLVRSEEKGRDTVARIASATGSTDVTHGVADLADLDSVRAFAADVTERFDHLDALVHNAGAMFSQRRETVDGIETTFQVHVVAPFLLTGLLMPTLRAAPRPPARVVWVTSGGMYTERLDVATIESPGDYRPATAYARAKRAQVVLTDQLARRLDRDEVVVHAMHPGWAATPGVERSLPVFNRVMGPILRSPREGADTTVWLVASDAPTRTSGELWLDRAVRSPHKLPVTRSSRGEAERLYREVVSRAGLDPAAAATV